MTKIFGIYASNGLSSQDILERSFIQFLETQGASEKTRKNYKSDLRKFFAFMSDRPFTPEALVNYQSQLTKDVAIATRNRHLSTLRSFLQFCHSQGLIANFFYSSLLAALTIQKPDKTSKEALLSSFEEYLQSEGASRSTIKNYVADVRQFLTWT